MAALSDQVHRSLGTDAWGEVYAPQTQARQSIPLLRLIARGDPPGCDDVCQYPLSLRKVEDLLFDRGIDICHETVRMWWNRFGSLFASDILRQRVKRMRGFKLVDDEVKYCSSFGYDNRSVVTTLSRGDAFALV